MSIMHEPQYQSILLCMTDENSCYLDAGCYGLPWTTPKPTPKLTNMDLWYNGKCLLTLCLSKKPETYQVPCIRNLSTRWLWIQQVHSDYHEQKQQRTSGLSFRKYFIPLNIPQQDNHSCIYLSWFHTFSHLL